MILAIVPAYNEAKTIDTVVKDLLGVVDSVLVVDDASTDGTASIAQKSGAVVLRHRLNRGQGAALETGHAFARKHNANVTVHFDADGQFSVHDIPRAISRLAEKNVDIILGTRAHTKNTVPFLKRAIILPAARLVDMVFGSVSLSDAHNGFRVMNRRALDVLRLKHDRMAHASEIPQLIGRHSLRYAELPIAVTYREFGQGLFGGFKVLRDLLMGRFI